MLPNSNPVPTPSNPVPDGVPVHTGEPRPVPRPPEGDGDGVRWAGRCAAKINLRSPSGTGFAT
jgi:hypothetical protein